MSDVNYLAYAQAVGSRNPTAEGLDKIAATLDAQKKQEYMLSQMVQKQQAAEVTGKINAIKLSELQREQQNAEGERTALAAMEPSAKFVPNGNSLASMAMPGAAAMAKPEFAQGSEQKPSVFNTPGKMGQSSVATNSDRTLLDYYAKNDRAKYDGMQKVMLEKFKALSEVDPAAAVKWYGEVSGQKMTYAGKKGDYSIINAHDGSVIAVNTKNPADVQVVQKGTPKPDQEALLDKRFANQQALQSQQIAAQDRRTAQQIAAADRRAEKTANGGGLGKLDIESAKVLIRTLPKLKEEAVAANGSIDRIDTMMTLVKAGVGGKKGQILSTLAPYAELAGVNTKSMNDAQTYEIMAKTIGGSMRMQIVGPGPVSNYENQLLQKISGGGSAATGAATELLGYYRKMAKEKVDDYNGSVESVSEFSPATKKIYKKVGGSSPSSPPAPKGKPSPKLSKAASAVDERY